MTLPEVLVAMVIMAVVGASLVRLLMTQNRFFDHQLGTRSARSVSRGAVNLLMSDLRMVDASGSAGDTLGVVAAAAKSLTLRVPYAMGLVCQTGISIIVTMVPFDTLMLNTAAFSGYAWRDTVAGKYHYVETGSAVANSSPASCQGAFTTVPNARVVAVTPAPAAGATSGGLSLGAPVLLYQRIKYDFAASTTYPGRFGLWRTLQRTGLTEEIAAPFDTSAAFKFFVLNVDSSQAAVPAQLADLRGIDIVFNAMSERAAQGRTRPQESRTTTAVFFKNRLN